MNNFKRLYIKRGTGSKESEWGTGKYYENILIGKYFYSFIFTF